MLFRAKDTSSSQRFDCRDWARWDIVESVILKG